jgi:hypothetical protein
MRGICVDFKTLGSAYFGQRMALPAGGASVFGGNVLNRQAFWRASGGAGECRR